MVKREPLKAGTKLWDRYTITEKIGEGANCLVYDAIYKDDCDIEYKVRIKECFPYNPAFSRNCSGEIVSKFDDITLEPFIKRYKKSYRNLVALRNRPALTNIIVSPRGLFDENNTVYTVFDGDQGKDYEAILKENKAASNYGTLEKVFERFIKIASAVDVFHNEYEQFSGSNSHCCLDLKPHNILIVNTNPETIKLFDLDSIISEDSSDNEVFLSEGFASSEQLTGDINQISKQSDIYAIGAMLYYVLFGKTYDCIDEINASDIEYSTMLFPDFQPFLKDELKKFFSKTLAIWPDARYENMGEVISQLKALLYYSYPLSGGYKCERTETGAIHDQILSELDSIGELLCSPQVVNNDAIFKRVCILLDIRKCHSDLRSNAKKIFIDKRFTDFLKKQIFLKEINLQEKVDKVVILIGALYLQEKQSCNMAIHEQMERCFGWLCENGYQSEYSHLLFDYIKDKVQKLKEEAEVFSFIEKAAPVILDSNNTKSDGLIDIFNIVCQKCPEHYFVLSLFECLYFEDDSKISINVVDSDAMLIGVTSSEQSESSFDESNELSESVKEFAKSVLFKEGETLTQKRRFFSQASNYYYNYNKNDSFMAHSLQFVADCYKWDDISICSEGYDRDEAFSALYEKYPRFMYPIYEVIKKK